MSAYLMWAIVLLVLGLALVFMEMFIPSGGALGTLAALCVIASIVLAFYSSPRDGMILLGAAIIGVPACIIAAIKWWPSTPIGRRVLLKPPTPEEVLPDNPEFRELRKLVGKVGRARSLMLPSGAVLVDGRVIDATAEGMAVEAGQPVRVIEVRGSMVVVRLIDEEEAQAAAQGPDAAAAGDNILSKPIDSLGLKSLDDKVS
ncbi:MAG: serine protease [Planctomycetia bacterium]|nr:serine protease [Planctomycetia bacterium]